MRAALPGHQRVVFLAPARILGAGLAAEVEQGRADGQRQAVAVAGVGGVRSLKERPEADQFLLTVKASNPAKFHDASSRFLCPFVGLLCRTWTFYQTAGC